MASVNEISSERMNTFTITVPIGAESAMLRTMSRKMGWKMKVSRPSRKTHPANMSEKEFYAKIEHSKEQARKGEMGPQFNSASELIEYLKTL